MLNKENPPLRVDGRAMDFWQLIPEKVDDAALYAAVAILLWRRPLNGGADNSAIAWRPQQGRDKGIIKRCDDANNEERF